MKKFEVIVLAAGLGTRMKSNLPKVLHPVCGEPILGLLLSTLNQGLKKIQSDAHFNIVVGHGRDQVIEVVQNLVADRVIGFPFSFTVQEAQRGTGHAVQLALKASHQSSHALVVNGDLPLLTVDLLVTFLEAFQKSKNVAALASFVTKEPGQYGRVLRRGKRFVGVVEFKDATGAQKKITEVNSGLYAFAKPFLVEGAAKLKNTNAGKEFYLPDLFRFASQKKKPILAMPLPAESLLGVNTMSELASAEEILFRRTREHWMNEGVRLQNPNSIYIGPKVKMAGGCRVSAGAMLLGNTEIAEDVTIGAYCELRDVTVGKGTTLRHSTFAERAVIGADCAVGPMAHLRPGTELKDHVRIGNFVEIKESTIGSQTNVAHLSYIGDAELGSNINVGCGFVTCNYDGQTREGRRKHRSKIGNGVFIGSDCQVVAPIEIADGTYIASGSTVTDSVKEKDSLVVARSRQVTKPGYAKKYKSK